MLQPNLRDWAIALISFSSWGQAKVVLMSSVWLFLDSVRLKPKDIQAEYIRGSLRLFPMHWTMGMGCEKFRAEVSDHLPFLASFRIDRSRD